MNPNSVENKAHFIKGKNRERNMLASQMAKVWQCVE